VLNQKQHMTRKMTMLQEMKEYDFCDICNAHDIGLCFHLQPGKVLFFVKIPAMKSKQLVTVLLHVMLVLVINYHCL
jgi:hypothetical protein